MSWQRKIEDFPYIDKIVNFLIGSLLFFVLNTTFVYQTCFIIVLCVALLKECYDWYVQDWENIDLWDTVCVMSGAFVMALL